MENLNKNLQKLEKIIKNFKKYPSYIETILGKSEIFGEKVLKKFEKRYLGFFFGEKF